MKYKVLILNDGSQYKNWGIRACIDGLKKIFFQDGSFEVETLSHQFMHKKYSFEPKIFGKKIFLEGSRATKFLPEFHVLPKIADEFEYVFNLWKTGKGGAGVKVFFDAIEEIDWVVFNAEGSVYRNNIGAIKGLFMLWVASKLGKKVAFMNGSVTLTLVDSVLPAMVHKVFNICDFVGVREPVSKQNIIDFYPELESQIEVFPDSAFVLNKRSTDIKVLDFLNQDFWVFSKSMLPMDYSLTGGESNLVELILEIKKIVPNLVIMAKDVEDQNLQKVAKLTNSYFIGDNYSYDQIFTILRKAKFIISGRYHHLIFSTMVGCPPIPLTTSSQKIHGLQKFFHEKMHTPFDATYLQNEKSKILQEVGKILSDNSLRAWYESRSSQLKQDSLNQISSIRK